VPAYREIESVQEILLIDPEAAYGEVFRRKGNGWFIEIVHGRDAHLYLSSLELQLPMAELYEGIELDADMAS
jgi:Uma2 family endonuclease